MTSLILTEVYKDFIDYKKRGMSDYANDKGFIAYSNQIEDKYHQLFDIGTWMNALKYLLIVKEDMFLSFIIIIL